MRTLLCLLGLSLAVLAACEDGGHHDHTGAESCQRIIDVCHDVDPGHGEVHDCHNTAHDEGADACDPIEQRCVMLCQALFTTDGGTHHGDGHDAGH